MIVELTESLMSDIFNRANYPRDSAERVVLLELEDAVRELAYVRRHFAAKAGHVAAQLQEAVRLASTSGREPNACGALQSVAELEVLNGRIYAGRKNVAGLVNAAKSIGILDKSTVYTY